MIVVANPGTHPELAHLAVELARSGEVRYLTSASWADDSVLQRALRLPGLRSTRAATGLRRRALPHGVRRGDVRRIAGLHEVAFHVARARGADSMVRLMDRRTAAFQRGAARFVQRSAPRAVVAQYTGALEVFRAAAPGTTRVLNYPIAHHTWMERRFQREADSNPDWADTLQGFGLPAETLARLDAEIHLADAVLVPSAFVRRTFVESGVPERKVIVSNLGAEPAADRPVRAAHTGPLRLLYAGQVTQRKGLSYLLDAVAAVPDVELRIVGHRPPALDGRLSDLERVQVLPSLERTRLLEQYDWADLLVLPSLAEGFPLVAVEAMSRGTAAVLSDSAAADDLIADGVHGLRVESGDAADLARVLALAAADRALVSRMGAAAAQRAAGFTWRAYAERTAGLLRALVDGS
jgi:glycosyltransferase involved in cell wall biosynthesis